MAFQISRLYDFQPGTKALSGQVDSEFNQLVDAHNDFDSAVDAFLATLASVNGADQVGVTGITDLDGTTVQAILESLRNKLKSTTDNSSGADFIGATALKEGGATTVQGQLKELLNNVVTVNNNEAARQIAERLRATAALSQANAESLRAAAEQGRVEADILRGQTVEAIEQNYAPRLTSVEEQINDLDADKEEKSVVALKAEKTYVDTQYSILDTKINSQASGSPKNTFATLALLQADATANTVDGKKSIYVVTADGNWYYWNGNAWTVGGIYQSTGIVDKSITGEKTDFIKPYSIISDERVVRGYYLDTPSTLKVHADFDTTDYELVDADTDYEVNFHRTTVFYDKNYNFLSYLSDVSNVIGKKIIHTPINCMFIRTTILKTYYSSYYFRPIVTPYKLGSNLKINSLSFLNRKNIAVKENALIGNFLNNDGTVIANANYNTTDFYPAKPNEIYEYNFHRRTVFYDENKTIIGYYDNNTIQRGAIYIKTPVNTAFLRTTVATSDWGTFYIKAKSYNLYELNNEVDMNDYMPANTILGSKWSSKIFKTLGDSITWQDGKAYSNSSYPASQGQIARGYQTILKEKLGFASYDNHGLSGKAMADGTANGYGLVTTADMINYTNTDLVIIAAGTNDFKLNVPIGILEVIGDTTFDKNTFYGAYRTVLEFILTNNPNIRIVLFTPLQRDNDGYDVNFTNSAGHKLIDYVNAIKELGQMYSLPVCDMYSNSGFTKLTLSTFTMDGLHPHDVGYEKMGGYASSFINNI